MRIILWDIETSPHTAYSFSTYKAFIAPAQFIEPSRMMCWAAKELGKPKIHYADERDGHKKMVVQLHKLLSEADACVTYNGNSFDVKVSNAEFLKYGLAPLPPTKQIDLYKVIRKNFRLASNKLEYVATALGIGEKVKHQGFHLWKDCLAGDAKAWATMTKYNKQDCVLLEDLYYKLLPWINNHPSVSLDTEVMVCTNCGSNKLQWRGYSTTKVGKYRRAQCTSCGHWMRARDNEVPRSTELLVSL